MEIKKEYEFDGYKGDKSQTGKKILHNVKRMGDKYFHSGDLFTFDKDYFLYFADRIGDTFRCVHTFVIFSGLSKSDCNSL